MIFDEKIKLCSTLWTKDYEMSVIEVLKKSRKDIIRSRSYYNIKVKY